MICFKFFRPYRVAGSLALGMRDDPVYRYYFGDSNLGFVSMMSFFIDEVRYRQKHGSILLSPQCVALVGIPPRCEMPADAISVHTRLLIRALGRRVARHWESVGALADAAPTGESDYLSVICTKHSFRGCGHGSRMMATLKQRSHAIYLETGSARNVEWYVNLGFMVTSAQELPDGPMLWTMQWQPPARPGEPAD
ncbi:MAG TPA: hypothetical protein VNF47_09580 [Streptosporangiaceae bacterium]|nr:hypothetical protein [Streptosporangiaceae bacterium]